MITENIIRCVFERKFVLRCDNCNDKDFTDTYYKTSKGEILDCCLDKNMREVDVDWKGEKNGNGIKEAN